MRTTLTLCSLLLAAAACSAEETLREVSWSKLKEAGVLPNGEVIPADENTPFERLKIVNNADVKTSIRILNIGRPGVTKATYALVGRIRHEGVVGVGYLEMWGHFPGGKRFYSRTLEASGPMRQIEGSSPWRPVILPFFGKDTSTRPIGLEINVVLPGKGTVYVGPLTLKQYEAGEDPLRVAGSWWSDRAGGWIGGIGGSVLGCLGGLVGVLGGMGRGRRFVLGLMGVCCVLGVIALGVGVFAVIAGQPNGVWYPLVLGGGLAAVLFGALLPVTRRGYIQRELRKMEAQDAG